MFKLLYGKFTQDNAYRILSELAEFYRRYNKTFWCVFSVYSVVPTYGLYYLYTVSQKIKPKCFYVFITSYTTFALSHAGVQVRCHVERLRNRLIRRASRATAVVTGACRDNSRRWSLPQMYKNEAREAKL